MHSYECQNGSQISQIERKVRWWQMQRWLKEVRGSLPWLRTRKAA